MKLADRPTGISLFMIVLLVSSLAAAEPFTVGTWNIHRGRNIERVIEELETAPIGASAILALQEVSPQKKHAELLAARFGLNFHYFGSDAILTRYSIVRAGAIVSNPQTGRHTPWAELEVEPGRIVRVYSPHLSYKLKTNPFIGDVRGQEMKVILDHADTFDGPVIIAGDLNSVGSFLGGHDREPAIRLLRARGFRDELSAVACRTHTLVGRIDWIFSRGLQHAGAVKGRYAGSDHRWMLARVKL
ncbi:MAG TPA: endonuclease/exonuclease/phosphatase family protein [Bdellovibrionales bacterium]|nr:endonuclease/exonuclease/phosphatase family protein [Bdellovibrionales bacterium]